MTHSPACGCSVCWAHNYCDSLNMFPCPALDDQPSPLPTDYFKYYDYTLEFLSLSHQ